MPPSRDDHTSAARALTLLRLFLGVVFVVAALGKFTIYNEIWTSQNFDPAGTVQQYSYDMALVWLPQPTLQFDIGVNIGLNRNTPAIVSYVGVSTRF